MSLLSTLGAAGTAMGKGTTALGMISSTAAFLRGDQLPKGIGGMVFDIPLSESLSLSSQVTDHYIEDNTAMQDHCALAPRTVTVTGLVAEMVFTKTELEKYAQELLDRLTALGAIGPGLSSSAASAIAEAHRAKESYDKMAKQYNTVAAMVGGDPDKIAQANKTKQRAFYEAIETMWQNRTLVSVETPWKTFPSMIIESASFDQDESTKYQTTVSITLREIRTISTTSIVGTLKGRVAGGMAPVADKGVSQGQNVSLAKQGVKAVLDKIMGG